MQQPIMYQLLPICKTGGFNSVDARLLHTFLDSKQEFTNWIKNRIDEYGFVECSDFLIILSKSTGGRPRTDYFVSLDMAKELAMVERTEKGKQARQYFIECEKQLAGGLKQIDFSDPLAAAQAFIAAETERRQLAMQVAQITPKAAALDLISAADGDLCLTDAAKNLQIPPKKLIDYLQSHRWIFKRNGQGGWISYQPRINAGLLRHVEYRYQSKGEERINTQVRVTAKGLAKLAEILSK